jgi:hypothetical protein
MSDQNGKKKKKSATLMYNELWKCAWCKHIYIVKPPASFFKKKNTTIIIIKGQLLGLTKD